MDEEKAAPGESQDERVDLLNLVGWSILDIQENDHQYQFAAEVAVQATSCPLCQTEMTPYRFGLRKHTFVDLPMHGKHVQILARLQRYRCRNCHKTFLDPTPLMSEQHSATMRLVNYIERETLSLSSRTFLSLSHETGVPEDTIRRMFDSCVKRLEDARPAPSPVVLGIDELYLLGAPRCILTDIRARTVVDLLMNRNQETVIKWLRQIPEKSHVQVVTMDMWQPYRNAVREVLPQASIIVDKFHIQRMGNEALEQVRKTIRASLTDTQRRSLMRDRHILLKRQRSLTVKEQLVMEVWTANFPALGKAYAMKEGFFSIWDASTKEEAHERYFAWMAQITPDIADAFLPIALTVENWGDEVFSYWDYNGTISNAFTEAKNGALRVVNRVGRGYSLPVIRAKVLFAEEIARKYPRLRKQFQPGQETQEE